MYYIEILKEEKETYISNTNAEDNSLNRFKVNFKSYLILGIFR